MSGKVVADYIVYFAICGKMILNEGEVGGRRRRVPDQSSQLSSSLWLAATTQKFPFIKSAFLPLGQMSTSDKVHTHTSCILPAPLTYYRQLSNLHLKGHNTQSGSSSTAVPQSIPKVSLQCLTLSVVACLVL